MSDCFYDARSGDKHVTRILHHKGEVGDGRRIHRASRTGTEDRRDLRDHSGDLRVAEEDFRVPSQTDHAFLYAGAPGVVEPDDRCADLQGHIHDLAYFFGVRLGQGASEDGEVLAENEDETSADSAGSRHDAVAEILLLVKSKIDAAVLDESFHFLEALRVEEHLEPLAGGELAFAVLFFDSLRSAAELGRFLQFPEAEKFKLREQDKLLRFLQLPEAEKFILFP